MFESQQFGEKEFPAPHLLILGGVHGDEPAGVEAAMELIKRFNAITVRGCITVVPIVNPPAWQSQSRCGPDGLDLARTCPGRRDGSPTERIAAAVSRLISESTALVDLHTGGRAMEIFPLAGYMMVRDAAILKQQRRMASTFSMPIIWGTSAELNGRTLSVARDHRIPAIYAENGGAEANPKIVSAYVNGCLSVAAMLGLVDVIDVIDATRPSPSTDQPIVVEDTSSGSGHLQICQPSPCDGRFEACVALGDEVTAGDPLGSVIATDTRRRVTVEAEKTGKLIALRAISDVQRGDSLGVILENR